MGTMHGRLHRVCDAGGQVAKQPECDKWKLFLVDWGYNTPKERERAAANPRIEVIDLSRFAALAGGPLLASQHEL